MATRFLCVLLLGAALAALPAAAAAKDPVEGGFHHYVFFWLNQPDSQAARREFLAELNKMKAIPTIRSFYVGTPAGTPRRDVVDDSWTFCLTVTFDDKAGWQVYNDHPLHDEFRKKAGLWKRVQVYDAIRQE
jgi:hypothetical protein